MRWFKAYHRRLLYRLYHGNLFSGPDKLEQMAPFLVGVGLTLALAYQFDLAGKPSGKWLFALLCAPGGLWFFYVLFHEFRSLPGRYRRHRRLEEPAELE